MLKTVLSCNLKLKFGMGALSLIPVPKKMLNRTNIHTKTENCKIFGLVSDHNSSHQVKKKTTTLLLVDSAHKYVCAKCHYPLSENKRTNIYNLIRLII